MAATNAASIMAANKTFSSLHSLTPGRAFPPITRRPQAAAPRGSTFVRAVAVSPSGLESKSLGELRALAREQGVRGDTKAELVKLLMGSAGNGSASGAPAAVSSSAPATASSSGAASSLNDLQRMPLAMLKTLARQKGIQGGTRDQLIATLSGLSGAPAPPPPPPIQSAWTPTPTPSEAPAAAAAPPPTPTPAAVPAASAASAGSYEVDIRSKPLGQLRVLARQKGLKGASKEEIVKELLALQSAAAGSAPAPSPPKVIPSPAAAAAAAKGNGAAATVPSPVAPKPKASPAKAAPEEDEIVKALMELEVGHLRYLAKERGLRGNDKEELVKLLAQVPPPKGIPPRTVIASALPPSAAAVAAATAAAITKAAASPSPLSAPGPAPVSPQPQFPSPPSSLEPLQPRSIPPTPAGPVVIAPVRGYSGGDLERMSLKALRSLARRKGLSGNTKAQLISSILKEQDAAISAGAASGQVTVLPPFQSDTTAAGTALARQAQPAILGAEIAALKEKMGAFQSKAETKEADSLSEDGVFLRNVLVGGLGLAVIPILLPLTMNNMLQTVTLNPSDEMAKQMSLEASLLLQSMINQQTKVLTDMKTLVPLVAPDAAPEIRAAKADEFCKNVPPSLQTPDTATFCKAITAIREASQK